MVKITSHTFPLLLDVIVLIKGRPKRGVVQWSKHNGNRFVMSGRHGDHKLNRSKGRSSDKFWPQRWLPGDPAIRSVRILSFGYNATYGFADISAMSKLHEYAEDLLMAMKFAPGGQYEELAIGQVGKTVARSSVDC